MQDVLDLKKEGNSRPVTPLSHGSKLVSADFHGAELEVVRSTCVSRVGVKGIVVRDSRFAFVLVTESDNMKSELGLFSSLFLRAGRLKSAKM